MQPGRISAHYVELQARLASGRAQVGVIGLGYVGLPPAVELARAGYVVVGLDVDEGKVAKVNRAESYVRDLDPRDLSTIVEKGSFRATRELAALGEVDSTSICVPTPLSKTRDPDMSYVNAAVDMIVMPQWSGAIQIASL